MTVVTVKASPPNKIRNKTKKKKNNIKQNQ